MRRWGAPILLNNTNQSVSAAGSGAGCEAAHPTRLRIPTCCTHRVCAWSWGRFISEVVSHGDHQGAGRIPRVAAAARRGSRGRHGDEDCDIEEGKTQEGKQLSDRQLEYADMGREFLFDVTKKTLDEGPFFVQLRIVRALLRAYPERINDAAVSSGFDGNEGTAFFGNYGCQNQPAVKAFVTQHICSRCMETLKKRLHQLRLTGIRRPGCGRYHDSVCAECTGNGNSFDVSLNLAYFISSLGLPTKSSW
jgi:hypothetical protein